MPGRERGALGLVVILVALVVVALLAAQALKRYGLAPQASKAASPGERARAPGAVSVEAIDVDSAPTTPAGALERARGVEDMLKRQVDERAAQMDKVK